MMMRFLKSLFRPKVAPAPLSAAVYFVNDRMLVASSSRTKPGFYLDHSYEVILAPFAEETVAAALRKALDGSARVLAGPSRDEFDEMARAQVKLAGLRSRKAFMAQARHLSVQEHQGQIIVEPSVNGGKDGFLGAADQIEVMSADDLIVAAQRIRAILMMERGPVSAAEDPAQTSLRPST